MVSGGLSVKISFVVVKDSLCRLELKESYSIFIIFSLIKGSLINSSKRAIKVSEFSLKILRIFSQRILKFFNFPLFFKALIKMEVSQKGTYSGSLSLFMATSKQSPKSMWITCPVYWSKRMLLRCLSPRPKIYPTILMAAKDLIKQYYILEVSSIEFFEIKKKSLISVDWRFCLTCLKI